MTPTQLFENLYQDVTIYLQENYQHMIQHPNFNPPYRTLYRDYKKQIYMKYKIDFITISFHTPFIVSDMDLLIGISSNESCDFDISYHMGHKIENISCSPNQLYFFQQPYFIKKMRNIYQHIHIIPDNHKEHIQYQLFYISFNIHMMKYFFHKIIQTNSYVYYDGFFEKINHHNYEHYNQLKELYQDEYILFEKKYFEQKIMKRKQHKINQIHQELFPLFNSPSSLSFFQFISFI